jgi:hypothetical protein
VKEEFGENVTNARLSDWIADFAESGDDWETNTLELVNGLGHTARVLSLFIRLPLCKAHFEDHMVELAMAIHRAAEACGGMEDCGDRGPHGQGKPLRSVSPNDRHA